MTITVLFFACLLASCLAEDWQILPGTNWCGRGNKAKSYYDLGFFWRTDACCREHDHCSKRILQDTTAYGITNFYGYTIMSCDCDDRFYQCLEKSGSAASTFVLDIFFNKLKFKCVFLKCMYKENGICQRYGGTLKQWSGN
eukprot:gene7510-13290_t